MSAPPAPAKKQAPWKGFLSGSLGAMASGAVTHPIDLVKVRMQLYGQGSEASGSASKAPPLKAPPGMMRTGYLVVKHEGTFGLYKGLSASLMRQASFIGTKFGAYDLLKSAVPKDADGGLSFWKMTLCGLGAGAIGAAVGNPADLAMVRMQADGRLPLELRRNYRHGGEALMRVVREEGVFALWRGCAPTVNRAMIVTASQMAVYDKSKAVILKESGAKDGLAVQTGASFIAGVVAALTSNPIDLAKSRLMTMKPDAEWTDAVHRDDGLHREDGEERGTGGAVQGAHTHRGEAGATQHGEVHLGGSHEETFGKRRLTTGVDPPRVRRR